VKRNFRELLNSRPVNVRSVLGPRTREAGRRKDCQPERLRSNPSSTAFSSTVVALGMCSLSLSGTCKLRNSRARHPRLTYEFALKTVDTVTVKLTCPVCQNSDIQPIQRSSLNPNLPQRDTVIGYRCLNGHVFTPEKAEGAASTHL
jgi:hypothetical protein